MGEVFEAFDTQLGQQVALKLIRPQIAASAIAIARFKREVQLGREVGHANLCRVFDIGSHIEESGRQVLFLTMELIRGTTLAQAISGRAVPVSEAAPLIFEMASALAALHRTGIVHRDFKPGNVMLARDGGTDIRAVVTDFGLAFDAGSNHPRLTAHEVVPGTPAYMAPEQLLGLPPTPAVDVFALGVVMYEMLAGRLPFEFRGLRQLPPAPSSYSPGLERRWDAVVLACLQPDPESRPKDAQAVLDLLRDATPARFPARAWKRPAVWTLAAVSALCLALSYLAPGMLRHRPPQSALGHYHAGIRLLADGAAQAALNELGAAIRIDAGFVLAHIRRAEAALQLEDFDEAQNELLRVPAGIPTVLLPKPDRIRLQAVHALALQEFGQAEQEYRRLAAAVPREEQPEALVSSAHAAILNENPAAALEACRQAQAINPDYAPAVLLSAVLQAHRRDTGLAAAGFERAIDLNRNASNLPGQIQAELEYAQMVSAGATTVELDRARGLLSEALALSRTLHDRYLEVQCMLLESELSFAHADAPAGQRIAQEALDLALHSGNQALVMQARVKLGRSLVFGSQLVDGEKAFREVLDAPVRNAIPREQARASAELGQLELKRNRSAQALPLLAKAMQYFAKSGSRHEEARVILMTGYAQLELAQFEASLDSFRRALDLSYKTQDLDMASLAEESIAGALMTEEVYPEALQHLEADRQLLGTAADPRIVAYNTVSRADALWRSGEMAAANALLEELQRSPLAAKDPELTGEIYISAGEMALANRDFSAAARYAKLSRGLGLTQYPRFTIPFDLIDCSANQRIDVCRQAVQTAERLQIPRLLRKARVSLAAAEMQAGDATNAAELARQVVASLPPQGFEVTRFAIAAITHDSPSAQSALARIRAAWGQSAYDTFTSRPDVRRDSKMLR
jgi:hypothetical protein